MIYQLEAARSSRVVAMFATLIVLSACGGGGGGGNSGAGGGNPPASSTYTVGGTVSGLSGAGLVLQMSSGNSLSIAADGSFTFGPSVAGGSTYNVSVSTHPISQRCFVSNGSGTASGNVTNVAIACRASIGKFLYVASSLSNTVAAFAINADTGALSPVPGSPFPTVVPQLVTITADPTGKFLFLAGSTVAVPASGTLAAYSVDPSSGILASTGATLTFIGQPTRIAFPTQKLLYLHTRAASTFQIHGYQYDSASGSLAPVNGLPTGPAPLNPAVFNASGTHYYVASFGPPAGLLDYIVDATSGMLTLAGEFSRNASGVVPIVDPSNSYLYLSVSYAGGIGLMKFSLDAGGAVADEGELLLLPPEFRAPAGFFFKEKFLYLLNQPSIGPANAPSSIYGFTVGNEGTLVPVPGSPFSSGKRITSLGPDTAGRYIAASNSIDGTLTLFRVDANTGTLTEANGSPYSPSAGFTPGPARFERSGKFMYIVEPALSLLTAYAVDAGVNPLTVVGTYTLSSKPSSTVTFVGEQ
jgi:6-phosphogluconolactonase (cycloisomerase 2 family)